MPVRYPGGLLAGCDEFGVICAAIPGLFLADADLAGAAAVLDRVASAANGGFVPASAKAGGEADPFANLWFIRAVHLFGKAGGDRALLNEKLLPLGKRILQEWITSGVGPVQMNGAGLLTADGNPQVLRLNALWYSALETMAADLKGQGDRAADHFERLAGRFRRSFGKMFWCERHGWLCSPEAQERGDHSDLPEPDQLLVTFLPASPTPRTKQRQMLQRIRERAMGKRGLRVRHAELGEVESPLALARLALGVAESGENAATAAAEAREILRVVGDLRGQAHTTGVAALYKDGAAVGGADLLTTAELLGAFVRVGEGGDRVRG